jgi:anti-sigma regulatory factor (Ser/Thr protein kinase)
VSTRTLQKHFRRTPRSVTEARHLAARFLSDQPHAVRESVELAVSELATNAVLHACTEFDLEVRVVAGNVRVLVADKSHGAPEIQEHAISESHGRGLQIVRRLSDRFGIDWCPGDGKTIWFEIDSERSTLRPHGKDVCQSGEVNDLADP